MMDGWLSKKKEEVITCPILAAHCITTKPKQYLTQAGWCCCRSNKGEVWEGGDSRQRAARGLDNSRLC